MKHVVLSCGSGGFLYAVPDEAAEHLSKYCIEFCTDWLLTSPYAEQYRRVWRKPDGAVFTYVSYTEADFIAWLNRWKFPDQPSFLVERFGGDAPKPYRNYPRYDF